LVKVNIHKAKTQLPRLIERALEGEEVTIAKAGHPLVRLIPIRPSKPVLSSARAAVVIKNGASTRNSFEHSARKRLA
jgi:prevent-host-death family protein